MNIIPSRSNTLLAASAMLLLLSTAVHSVTVDDYYENIFACDVCNLQTLVVAAGVEDQTINVLAVNRVQEVWQSYEIFTDLVGESGQPMLGNKTITPIPTPAEFVPGIQDMLLIAKSIMSYHLQTIPVGDLDLPPFPEPPDSAADLLAAPTVSRAFASAVGNLASADIVNQAILNAELSEIFNNLTSKVTVEFEDGSTMKFALEGTDIDRFSGEISVTYERIEGSGRDSEDFVLPETADDANGIIRSGSAGGSLGELIDLLDRMGGVTVSGLPSGGAGGSCNIDLTCSFDSAGNMNCIASVSGC